MDSDSDTDTNVPNYSAESARVDTFRKAISSWKKNQLDTTIGEEQDTLLLNAYTKKTADLYYSLKNYIENNTALSVTDNTLNEALGDPTTLTMDERIQILQSLFRDLIEFRFTYDTTLINSFRSEEALDTNII
jgi:regulator of replication initiation timing